MKSIFPIFLTLILLSCGQENPKQDSQDSSQQSKKDSTADKRDDERQVRSELQKKLTKKKQAYEKNASENIKKLNSKNIQAIRDSGVIKNAKSVGDEAPQFQLKNSKGEQVSLKDQLKKGDVVLLWYRGGWCPYCNLTLNHYQKMLPEIQKAGAQLIAIAPEIQDSIRRTQKGNDLDFMMVTDPGNKVAEKYGVVYQLIDSVAAMYQNGFNLHGYNGDESNQLPLAATYIIGQDGKIKYAFLDADYKNRATPEKVIAKLKK